MTQETTSFDYFAYQYDSQMGGQGDYSHKELIDPALLKCCKNLTDKKIYDIGCGNGYLDKTFVAQGASKVIASDISPSLIQIAKTKHADSRISYFERDARDFSGFLENQFDLVTLNMSIHYVEMLENLVKNISLVLKTGGRVAFTTIHPMYLMELNRPKHRLIMPYQHINQVQKIAKNYLNTYTDLSKWRKSDKIMLKRFLRPISTYIQVFAGFGFVLDTLIETSTAFSLPNGSIYTSNTPMNIAFGFLKT